jgi:hypothetical protein
MPTTHQDVCFIPLRRNNAVVAYTQVSERWFNTLNESKWCLNVEGYAHGVVEGKNWRLNIYIYTVLMKQKLSKKGNVVDHKNGERLDNSDRNLREATPSQNARNRKKSQTASSKYSGVSFEKDRGKNKWMVRVILDDKTSLQFRYAKEVHAAHQYNKQYDLEEFSKKNDLKDEDIVDFIQQQKAVKKLGPNGKELPSGIQTSKDKYRVLGTKKLAAKAFNTLKDAIEYRENGIKQIEQEKKQAILTSPIKRNENGECIIELFNKKKEKVCETIVDEDIYYTLKQYSWYASVHKFENGGERKY